MIRIVASARWDLEEGFEFYASQEIGLGDYFLSSVKADIESLKITAGVHRIVYADYHRLLCKTFPFAIYYTKRGQEITIFGVIDCRRDPCLDPRASQTRPANKRCLVINLRQRSVSFTG
jgi:hypothetical protein